ncbi:MAG: hypothetical protein J5952_02320 [Prevotella sp.]|nr:hypothetical protein [Prevotella sp.]
MAKIIRPFKVRRFEVETTFDGVEMSAVCRIVANTMTVTITKPFNGMVTQVHALYSNKRGMRIDKARDLAIDELELSYLDFTAIAKDFETYRDIVYKQRRYLLELERKRRCLTATLESVKRQYMADKIDANEERRSYKAISNALAQLEPDAERNYELMKRKYKLSIGYDYAKQIVLWIIHNEKEAKKLIDAHNKGQAEIQAWLDSNSNTTWEEWLNQHGEK